MILNLAKDQEVRNKKRLPWGSPCGCDRLSKAVQGQGIGYTEFTLLINKKGSLHLRPISPGGPAFFVFLVIGKSLVVRTMNKNICPAVSLACGQLCITFPFEGFRIGLTSPPPFFMFLIYVFVVSSVFLRPVTGFSGCTDIFTSIKFDFKPKSWTLVPTPRIGYQCVTFAGEHSLTIEAK